MTEVDVKDGEPTVSMSDGSWASAGDVQIVERVSSVDERLPVRYEVAKVATVVAFDTVPAGSDEPAI